MSYHLSVVPECNSPYLGPSMTAACPGSQFFLFMTLLDTLVRTKQDISGLCERVKPVDRVGEKYDFIVVGGGAAGAIVAARLSQIKEWQVLLIEAGPDEPPGTDVPSLFKMYAGTEIDWKYQTSNEKYACQSTNGSCSMPRGKCLGGSTAINSMIYLRGVPQDFDNWERNGNDGWSWTEVEPFFKRSENNGEIDRVGRKHHGTGGPLTIERFPWRPVLTKDILAATKERGFAISEDLNGDHTTGFCVMQSFSKDGVRESSAKAFLRPIRNRPNLHIALNATVTRVIIEDLRAVGVEFYKDGARQITHATREVVVSGGSINSPQILLLSGIGPKEHLESVGVPLTKHLPGVGENLHDHPQVIIPWNINEPDVNDLNWAVAAEYVAFRKGPMASSGLNQINGILGSTNATAEYPDVQINFLGYQAACGTTGEVDALKSNGKRSVNMTVAYLHPRSRGILRLASNDPFEHPSMTVNFLQDAQDVEILAEAIEIALSLGNTTAMAKHKMTLANTPIAACSKKPPLSKEYWICYMHQTARGSYHPAGTCKMGPASDPLAVVDSQLRVHGLAGLRVADASIMPQLTSGNTAAPAMMIGERAADFITKDWGLA